MLGDKALPCVGKTLAIVDVETNGGYMDSGQVIEIGILRVENGVVVETYRSFVKPARHIPWWITQLTGITNEDLENAPFFEEIAVEVHRLLSGAIFVAHNVGFDHVFIKNEFRRLEMEWKAKKLCTVEISRAMYPKHKSHSLEAIIARHGFKPAARHRAFEDAKILWDFIVLAHKMRPYAFEQVIEDLLYSRKKVKVPTFEVEELFAENPTEETVVL